MNILKEPKADEGGKHRGASIGDEGQRYPGHRHEPHGHSDIFKGLKGEPGDNPHTDQSAEEIVGSLGN